jgi:hypothetical protein
MNTLLYILLILYILGAITSFLLEVLRIPYGLPTGKVIGEILIAALSAALWVFYFPSLFKRDKWDW